MVTIPLVEQLHHQIFDNLDLTLSVISCTLLLTDQSVYHLYYHLIELE
jgi:membrane-anchored protein YejM (alkaline phosphatase superfamily)